MAGLGDGPYRSGGSPPSSAAPVPRASPPPAPRLIEKGLIYSPAYGLNEFTVPQFDAFIRRSSPPGGPS